MHRLGARLLPGAAARARTAAAAAARCRRTPRSCARTPCGRAPIGPRRCPGTDGTGPALDARHAACRRTRGSVSRRVTVTARCAPASASSNESRSVLMQIGAALRAGPAARRARVSTSANRSPKRRRVVDAARREVEPLEPARPAGSSASSTPLPGVVARPPLADRSASRRPRGSAGSAPPPRGRPD